MLRRLRQKNGFLIKSNVYALKQTEENAVAPPKSCFPPHNIRI